MRSGALLNFQAIYCHYDDCSFSLYFILLDVIKGFSCAASILTRKTCAHKSHVIRMTSALSPIWPAENPAGLLSKAGESEGLRGHTHRGWQSSTTGFHCASEPCFFTETETDAECAPQARNFRRIITYYNSIKTLEDSASWSSWSSAQAHTWRVN